MNRLGISLGQVGDSINKLELTPQERADYQKILGNIINNAMASEMPKINKISYKDDAQKSELIKRRIALYRQVAKTLYWQELSNSKGSETILKRMQGQQGVKPATPTPRPSFSSEAMRRLELANR